MLICKTSDLKTAYKEWYWSIAFETLLMKRRISNIPIEMCTFEKYRLKPRI